MADPVTLLRSHIHQVHELMQTQVSWLDERAPAPAGPAPGYAEAVALYAHAVCVEDSTVNVLIRDRPPVFAALRIGQHLLPWDLCGLRDYAAAVYTATDGLLDRLTPALLDAPLDLSAVGLGWPSLAWVLNRFVVCETAMICGELAAAARHARVAPTALRMQAVAAQDGRANAIVRLRRDGRPAQDDAVVSAPG
jgi:hypothetical protein